jgi:large subunit ribosomal protein L20
MKAGRYAYVHRRTKKRDFRRLWIVRLNAALKARGVHYNRFIRNMEDTKVLLNRKVLSELAIHHPDAFDAVVAAVMGEEVRQPANPSKEAVINPP